MHARSKPAFSGGGGGGGGKKNIVSLLSVDLAQRVVMVNTTLVLLPTRSKLCYIKYLTPLNFLSILHKHGLNKTVSITILVLLCFRGFVSTYGFLFT